MHTEAVLRGQRVVLVPSTPDHVEKYHRWMTDPKLLKDTGTDPLTLAEVYEMQKHWQEDDDKLTFIILADVNGDIASLPMAGDVNVFLKGNPVDEDFEAEVGVMIAGILSGQRPRARGTETHVIICDRFPYIICEPVANAGAFPPFPLPYTVSESLVVRIGQHNGASIRLFQRLGFTETKGPNAFGEKEMRLRKDTSALSPL